MNRYSHRFHQQRSEVRVGRRSRTHTCPGEPRCADGLDPGTGDGRRRWPEKKRWTQSARLKRGGGGGANVVRGSARISKGRAPASGLTCSGGTEGDAAAAAVAARHGGNELGSWGWLGGGGGDGQWQMEGREGWGQFLFVARATRG